MKNYCKELQLQLNKKDDNNNNNSHHHHHDRDIIHLGVLDI